MITSPFEIPSIALAKTTASSRQESREFALQHGDTDEMSLERRRIAASHRVRLIDRGIDSLTLGKKHMILLFDRKIANLRKRTQTAETEDRIAELESQKAVETAEIDKQITEFHVDAGILENGCLNFDSLTLRLPCENKQTGRKGRARFTVAGFLYNIETYLGQLLKLEAEAHGKPQYAVCVEEDDDETEDSDIVTEEERAAMRAVK